jgi:hypothetical protein
MWLRSSAFSDGETIPRRFTWEGEDLSPQADLLKLKADEAVSIQGAMKVGVYEKNGEHRTNLDIVASHVLARAFLVYFTSSAGDPIKERIKNMLVAFIMCMQFEERSSATRRKSDIVRHIQFWLC